MQSLASAVQLIRIRAFRSSLMQLLEYMPAPTDIPDINGVDEDGNEVSS